MSAKIEETILELSRAAKKREKYIGQFESTVLFELVGTLKSIAESRVHSEETRVFCKMVLCEIAKKVENFNLGGGK